jgi:polyisoprenoid-binding protein YceI
MIVHLESGVSDKSRAPNSNADASPGNAARQPAHTAFSPPGTFLFGWLFHFEQRRIMKLQTMILLASLLPLRPAVSQIYSTNKGFISFFSEAPIANVDARNSNVTVELNTSTNELTCDIDMKDFDFKNGKMGRDAQRKYIETNEYPTAGFKGKMSGEIDFSKPGKYPATATGKLKIHGVENQVTEKGTVTIQKDKILVASEFYIRLADYKIDTPSILGKKMTKDNVLVKVQATLRPAASR